MAPKLQTDLHLPNVYPQHLLHQCNTCLYFTTSLLEYMQGQFDTGRLTAATSMHSLQSMYHGFAGFCLSEHDP